MSTAPLRYVSPDEDSARWDGFRFRDGDIVISTRSKSGTTWMQMICALLVLGSPDLPAPLPVLSPWLDHQIEPVEDVVRRLEAQRHRRFVKTHTPLDGVPLDPRATYVVVARHPLDLAVSLYHQSDNIDRERLAALTGSPARPRAARPSLHDWLVSWTTAEATPQDQMDSLVGVLHHAADAWLRRHEPNVVLVHYADLLADLEGEMRRLAGRLALAVPEEQWPALVDAATFARMRERADVVTPNALGVLRTTGRSSGAVAQGPGARCSPRASWPATRPASPGSLPAELVAWLHR